MSKENNTVNVTTENTKKEKVNASAIIAKYAALHSDDLTQEQLVEFCEALRTELDKLTENKNYWFNAYTEVNNKANNLKEQIAATATLLKALV